MSNALLLKAISKYGPDLQELMVIEEMAELTQAIIKMKRGKPSNLIEEIADVEIMLAQLKLMYDCHEEVESWKVLKLEKLRMMLDEH